MSKKKILTKEQAIQIIKTICPELENFVMNVYHTGEFDHNGERHADSIQTIEFQGQNVGSKWKIEIWEDEVFVYKDKRMAEITHGQFKAYRLLKEFGLVS